MKLETLLEFDFLYLKHCLNTIELQSFVLPICIGLYFISLYNMAMNNKKKYKYKAKNTLLGLILAYAKSENQVYKQLLMNRISRITVKLDLHSELNTLLEEVTRGNSNQEYIQLQVLKTHILETSDYLYTAMINA